MLILDSRVITYSLTQLANVPIEHHVKVIGKASPDASRLKTYWQQRQPWQGKTYWAKDSKHYQVAENQNWQCLVTIFLQSSPSLRNKQ